MVIWGDGFGSLLALPSPVFPPKTKFDPGAGKTKTDNKCKRASSPDQNLPPASGRHMRVFVTGSPVHLEANQLRKRIRKQVRQTKRSKVFKHRSMTVGIKQLFGNSEKLSYSEFPSTSREPRRRRNTVEVKSGRNIGKSERSSMVNDARLALSESGTRRQMYDIVCVVES